MRTDAHQDQGGGVSVLRTLHAKHVASKRFVWHPHSQEWLKTAYGMGQRFQIAQHYVASIHELGALVETTRADPRAFIVRGELAEGRDASKPVFRRYLKRPDKPDPDFVDVPRSYCMADIDGWAIPDGFDLSEDVDLLVERAIGELLPPEFHDVTAFWQLSSSAGFSKGTLKVHAWFFFDRPLETLVLKRWMGLKAQGIDQALFNAVQVHYCADPLIEGGADPVSRRTGWVQGQHDVVTLPLFDTEGMARENWDKRRSGAAAAGLSPSQAATLEGALSALGDSEGQAGFHLPLRRAAWLYASKTPPWERDLAAIKDRMTAAILAAFVDHRKRDGVANYLTDAYLDAVILSAFEKLPDGGGWEACAPEHKPCTDNADDCRLRMQTAIGDFLAHPSRHSGLTMEMQPRQGLVVAEVGLGKTAAALQEIAPFIAREKAAGRPHRVLYLVPEHQLGNQIITRAAAAGVSAATWRGRNYIDPASGPMCLDLESVKVAEEAGVRVDKFVCGALLAKGKPRCPYFFTCAWQAQKPTAADADLVVAAHASAFNRLPTEITADLGLVIIDEAFWQTGLQQKTVSIETFANDPLDHPVLVRDPDGTQRTHDGKTNDLHTIRAQAERAIRTAVAAGAMGYVQRRHFVAEALTADLCAMAGKLEWERRRDIPMYPGMPLAERRAAARMIAVNAQLPRIHSFWTALREMLEADNEATGRIELEQVERKNGSQLVAVLNLKKPLGKSILEHPVLFLDGTADIGVVRHFLPEIELLAEERPEQPHVTVRQVVGALSKTSLSNREGLVSELRDFVALTAAGQSALVVTHKELRAEFEGMPHVAVAHFGAVAGRDDWGKVGHVFIIGRPQPRPDDTRAMAAQLTGRPIPLADPVRATRGILMTDGRGVGIEVSRYDDPDLEAVRAAVTDAAAIQSIGRGRGCNRTADTPLDVHLLGNIITPLPVTSLSEWNDVAPNPIARMLARGAVFGSPRDASAAYTDLFKTPKAAEHALARGRVAGHFPPNALYKQYYKGLGGKCLHQVDYRPGGKGQQQRTAWVSPDRLEAFQTWLTELLGELMVYSVDGEQPDPSPSDPRPERPKEPPPNPDDPEPSWAGEPPDWIDEDPGWEPDPNGPDLADPDRWHAQFSDTPPCQKSETEDDMHYSDSDEVLLDPGAVYSRGMLEPPHSDEWTIAVPGKLPIRVRGRPGVLTEAPRLMLLWPGPPPPVRARTDCSAAALLPEALAGPQCFASEPGD